jgi:hypothetical protein
MSAVRETLGLTPAAAAILEGMPDPSLLHRADRDGTTVILAGSVVLACYPPPTPGCATSRWRCAGSWASAAGRS